MIYVLVFDTEQERDHFVDLYEKNYQLMYRIALGILKDRQRAEDAVSEAFLSLAENLEKYFQKNESEMTALCVTILKNKCLDQLRRDRKLSDREIETILFDQESESFVPESEMEQKETLDTVEKILSNLPEVYRQTFILRYYYDYGPRKIAKLLGVSVRTVDSRLYQAKKQIRRMWDEEEKERGR